MYVPSGSFASRLLLLLPGAAVTPAAIRGGPGGGMAEGCRPRRTACCHLPHPAPQYLTSLFSSLATGLWRYTAFSPQLARCQAESTEPEVRRGWYQPIAISWGSQTIRSICGCAFVTKTIPLRFLSSSPLQAVTQKTQHWMLAKATVW